MFGVPISQNIPHIFGAGFPLIGKALLGQSSIILLLVLVILKPLATSLTLGSGNSGGVFAPSLFTGAALGGAFGGIMKQLLPGAGINPGAYAVVGMAAVFAGAARAPFTAILIVVEMTNDYRMIIPLMSGVIISLIVAELLFKESIYTLKLSKRGIHLRRGRDVDVMEAVRVDEVMVRQPITVSVDMPIAMLSGEFLRTGRHGFPVIGEDGNLFGVVSLEDYRRATTEREKPIDDLVIGDIATKDVVSVFPDEAVGIALHRMAPQDLSRLPVVARDDPKRLLGVVRRNDIVRAYEVGVLRREEARRRVSATRAIKDARAEFLDIHVSTGSVANGKKISELALPHEAVLVSIRRGDKLVIPHGDTVLLEGDVITTLCAHSCIDEIKAALNE
jgi:CIC family chloride channel protein